jgi:hypothetical protein
MKIHARTIQTVQIDAWSCVSRLPSRSCINELAYGLKAETLFKITFEQSFSTTRRTCNDLECRFRHDVRYNLIYFDTTAAELFDFYFVKHYSETAVQHCITYKVPAKEHFSQIVYRSEEWSGLIDYDATRTVQNDVVERQLLLKRLCRRTRLIKKHDDAVKKTEKMAKRAGSGSGGSDGYLINGGLGPVYYELGVGLPAEKLHLSPKASSRGLDRTEAKAFRVSELVYEQARLHYNAPAVRIKQGS